MLLKDSCWELLKCNICMGRHCLVSGENLLRSQWILDRVLETINSAHGFASKVKLTLQSVILVVVLKKTLFIIEAKRIKRISSREQCLYTRR